MSNRKERTQTQLWRIRPVDADLRIAEEDGHVFAGSEEAMVDHINGLHRETGLMHAARLIETASA
jgi:hypothetical protein